MSDHQATNRASHAVTQGRIWALAWPVMLSNITVPLLGLVDSAVLGHLPDAAYLGAVAIGNQMFTLLFWSFGFLRMGTTALTAHAHGRNQGQVEVLQQALWLSLPVLLLVLMAAALLLPWLLPLMGGSAVVQEGAREYLLIRLCAAPAVLAQYALTGWFIGLGHTRIPLIILTLVNVANALLDYLFVFGLNMTSDGVALGSMLADYSGLLLALGFARKLGLLTLGPRPALSLLQPMLRINRHLFIRTLCLLAVFAFFTAQGARQGELILAANAMLITLLMLISNALDGFAHAAEALTGQALGQRDPHAVRRTIRLTGVDMLLMALAMCLLFEILGPQLLTLLTDNPDLQLTLSQYQHFLFWLPLIGMASFWLDGIFIGAQATASMRNAMLAAGLLVFLPLWWLTRTWGNDGLWWSFYAFMLARALFMSGTFLTLFRRPINFL
jgi:MATE family multidrug resistance protein